MVSHGVTDGPGGNLPPFDAKPRSVGPPRLNPYHRLLSRFYEQLVFLNLLGQSRGLHKKYPPGQDPVETRRRQFLRNLAYICDFDKGGNTITAIAVEELSTCYIFRLASNESNDVIVQFLTTALTFIRNMDNCLEHEYQGRIEIFVRLCAEFSSKRIAKEKKCLFAAVKSCIASISNEDFTKAAELGRWLRDILSHDNDLELCTFAYDHRHSEFLSPKVLYDGEEHPTCSLPTRYTLFSSAKHYLGRLADHVRAPVALCSSARDMSYLLSNYNVCTVEMMEPVPAPAPDRHTHLQGFLNRMLGKANDERARIEGALRKWSSMTSALEKHGKTGFDKFVESYQSLKPRVHAEIQILEYFYRNKLQFAHDDRYIACSKPACYCCELYFQCHPARMVAPESHQNVWKNWGPPLVQEFSKNNSHAQEQVRILNEIIQHLRKQFISQIFQQITIGQRHPDSNTGITEPYDFVKGRVTYKASHAPPALYGSKQCDGQSETFDGRFAGPDVLDQMDEGYDTEDGGVCLEA